MERHETKRLDRRDDGFGTRWFDPKGGRIEVLDLAPGLSTPAAEEAMRARLAAFGKLAVPRLAPVRRLERNGQALSIVTAIPVGVSLSELLAATEFGTIALSDEGAFELATAVVRAVASVHELPGGVLHGALNPAHMMVQRDGSVVMTGWAFAGALGGLHRSRDQFWREFGLAFPSAATMPRIDQRADVTQLGCLVLAILLRRMLTGEEYPRGVGDLVRIVSAGDVAVASTDAALRGWLQHTLQLNTRGAFPTALEAARGFAQIASDADPPGDGRLTLEDAVAEMCGDRPSSPIVASSSAQDVTVSAH